MDKFFVIGLHFIADFPAQGPFLAESKQRNPLCMVVHCWIYTTIVGFAFFATTANSNWWQLMLLFSSHYVVDTMKAHYAKFSIAVDQLIHIAILLVLWQVKR